MAPLFTATDTFQGTQRLFPLFQLCMREREQDRGNVLLQGLFL
jgi:hypothetical protein